MLAVCLASVLVDELVRCGVTDAVLSPGSRSVSYTHLTLPTNIEV